MEAQTRLEHPAWRISPREDEAEDQYGHSNEVVIVDDGDPRISYSPYWTKSGISSEYGSTTHGTTTNSAWFSFTFSGTLIQVYGTIANHQDNVVTRYELDGNFSTYTAPTTPQTLYYQCFYTSPPLTAGSHTLIVTYEGNTSATFWFDFVQYGYPVPNATMGSPSQAVTTSNSHGPHFAVSFIVGIVLACAAGQALVTLCLCILWRRRKRSTRLPPIVHTTYTDKLELHGRPAPTPTPAPSCESSLGSTTVASPAVTNPSSKFAAPRRTRFLAMNSGGISIGPLASLSSVRKPRHLSEISSIVFAHSDPYANPSHLQHASIPVSPSVLGGGWSVGSFEGQARSQLGR